MRSNAVGPIRYLLAGSVETSRAEPRALSLEKDLSTEKTSRFRVSFFLNPFLFRTTHEERDDYTFIPLSRRVFLIDSIVGERGREGKG